MAGCFRWTIVPALAAGLSLAETAPARARQSVEDKQTWILSNRDTSKFEQIYGEVQNISLEALCDPARLTIHGAVRTRGILMASPRPRPNAPGKGEPNDSPSGPATTPRGPQGPASGTTASEERRYALTLPTDGPLRLQSCGLSISPGLVVEEAFEFEVDSLNFREIEVVGTFEAPVGSDRRGPMSTTSTGGFWFWAYSVGPTKTSRAGDRAGLLAVEDLVARPDRLAGEIVKVVGQFRGKNLFGDLDEDGPEDGWVIKDGAFAVWVVGKKPKGTGWSLDPASKGDTRRWVQVTGKLDRKGNVTRLKALEVALVSPPAPVKEP
ncbi:MAG TPA: hypothetical protein VI669_15180 [Vicinamibacteria bacterium]